MRLLYTGHADHGACLADRRAGCRCRPYPRGVVGQSVPMYRLYRDCRGGARSSRRLPQDAAAMIGMNRYIGSPVERTEDLRFLRGRGEYVGDLARDGLLHAAILRSPVAHGRIRALDVKPALALRGIHAVITAAAIGTVPRIPLRLQTSPATEPFRQPVIAVEKLRYVGEPIAVVLADSAALAEDGVDAIALEFEELPPIADRHISGRHEILLFEAAGSNLAMQFTALRGDADAAFAAADYTRRGRFASQRHTALPLEPRGLLAEWDAQADRLTESGAAKVPFF